MVGVRRAGAIVALAVPPAALRRGRMELFLTLHRPVAQEDVGNVADVAIVDPRRVRAADDVDIIADRELFHEGEVALGIVGDLPYRLLDRKSTRLKSSH